MSYNLLTTQFDQEIDDLSKINWRFHFWPDKGIILEHRHHMSRPTARHGWRVNQDISYDRLNSREYRGKFEEIDLDIQIRATDDLRSQVKFKGDKGGEWSRF